MLSAKYIKLLRKSTHKARLCTWCTPEQRANNTYISAKHRESTLYYAAVPFSFVVSFRGQQPTAMRRLGDEAAAIHFIKMIQWFLFVFGGVHWLRYLLQAAAAPLGDRNANFEDVYAPATSTS